MKLIRLKDNSRVSRDVLASIPTLVDKIKNKTLNQLEKEGLFVFPNQLSKTEDLTSDQIPLQITGNIVQTGNVMGFLGLGDEQLFITSRFDDTPGNFFLHNILQRVFNLPNLVNFHTISSPQTFFFDLLPFLFPTFLCNALRKGLFRQYIRQHQNNENLHGTPDIARHIRLNTPFTGRIAFYESRFTSDNPIIYLIRAVIENISRKPFGKHILTPIREQTANIIQGTPNFSKNLLPRIININRRQPVRHAYFREYRALQRLCLLIITHKKYASGSGTPLHGLLFNGAWLWEEYLAILLAKTFHHPRNHAKQGAQHLFSKNHGLIYPDFLSKNHNHPIVADAKYKPASAIHGNDYLQLLAYMFRFNANSAYMIYPEINPFATEKCLTLLSGSTYANNLMPRPNITLTKLPLILPNHTISTYHEYKNALHQAENRLLDILSQIFHIA